MHLDDKPPAIKRIKIEIPEKPKSKNGHVDIEGNLSYHWVSVHSLFSGEIGATPEDAVRHEVTL